MSSRVNFPKVVASHWANGPNRGEVLSRIIQTGTLIQKGTVVLPHDPTALCVTCGKPGTYPYKNGSMLTRKGECRACVGRRTMTRRWAEEREVMDEYRQRASEAHVGVPLTPEVSRKISVRLRGQKRMRASAHVLEAQAKGLLRKARELREMAGGTEHRLAPGGTDERKVLGLAVRLKLSCESIGAPWNPRVVTPSLKVDPRALRAQMIATVRALYPKMEPHGGWKLWGWVAMRRHVRRLQQGRQEDYPLELNLLETIFEMHRQLAGLNPR
jgi:hypothetical protein